MQKILFKDAFSDIEFDEEVSVYFDEVWVTDMTLVKNSNTLYISILSNHLIDWMYKKKAEEAVRLFAFKVFPLLIRSFRSTRQYRFAPHPRQNASAAADRSQRSGSGS